MTSDSRPALGNSIVLCLAESTVLQLAQVNITQKSINTSKA